MNKKGKLIFNLLLLFVMVMIFTLDANGEDKKRIRDHENIYIQPELVLLPGGEFIIGKKQKKAVEDNKKLYVNNPAHKVYVNPFYIDKYEVTNYQYFLFCKETGQKLPVFWGMDEFHCGLDFPNHPVVGVSYLEALEYAQWRKMRLPNGDELNKSLVNYGQHLKGTTQVGSYPANGYGLYDMVGNV